MTRPSNGTLKWIIGVTMIPMLGLAVGWGAMQAEVSNIKEFQREHSSRPNHPPAGERLSGLEQRVINQGEMIGKIEEKVDDIHDILIDRFGPPPLNSEND